jgi:hypothetical protein
VIRRCVYWRGTGDEGERNLTSLRSGERSDLPSPRLGPLPLSPSPSSETVSPLRFRSVIRPCSAAMHFVRREGTLDLAFTAFGEGGDSLVIALCTARCLSHKRSSCDS